MKLLSVNLESKEHQLASGTTQDGNTYSIIIGKNGTGKSRLLAKVANTFISARKYNQNHSYIKNARTNELTFANDGEIIKIQTGKGRTGRIFERNKKTKEFMCKRIIAASISPFDKFPLPEIEDKNQSFYNYIGFKTDQSYLSDKNLLTQFAISILNNNSNVAVKRTLRLLGYKSDIDIKFKHNLERYFNQRISRYDTFREYVIHNKDLYSKVLADNNLMMSNMILRELSDEYSINVINKKTNSPTYTKTINDIIKTQNLPDSFNNLSSIDEKIKERLIQSLLLSISSVTSITLRKNNSNQKFTLNDSSSGERALLLLVCSIASQITNDSLVLIDEPEISLHPEWQENFIDLIYNAFSGYKRCHFIIATHSPLIISNLPNNDCFILNMDEGTLFSSTEYINKSVDFQLAKLFKTPGYQNEYLNRLCVSILGDLAGKGSLSEEQNKNANFLISIVDKLDDGDTVKSLINIIKNALELSLKC